MERSEDFGLVSVDADAEGASQPFKLLQEPEQVAEGEADGCVIHDG